ncbi:MAG TPA: hypothetical protein VFQ79_01125 [Bryobacteraceae bacterium]|nr:hypothetical protein [Bryobacteraceae bacterium]
MNPLWNLAFLAAPVLQVLLISRVIAGACKSFPLVGVYAVFTFLATIAEGAAFLGVYPMSVLYERIYWVNEAILQILIFSIIISLIYQAMPATPRRNAASRWLVASAVAALVLSLIGSYDVNLNAWMTQVSRNLAFASAVLSFLLWTLLLSRHSRNTQLLLVSAAFGIQATGKALGHSLRYLKFVSFGDVVMILTYLVSLFVLWKALGISRASEERAVRSGHTVV